MKVDVAEGLRNPEGDKLTAARAGIPAVATPAYSHFHSAHFPRLILSQSSAWLQPFP